MKAARLSAIMAAMVILGGVSISLAADRHHTKMTEHSGPAEAGQSAFAALAEIVAILEADPATDWSEVDIPTLREHLVDMNQLILNAAAVERSIADGLEVTITGEGRTVDAIQRMVPAHAIELSKIPSWSATTELVDDGARLIVTSIERSGKTKLRGLGFFGLMATGSHHQMHHLAIARGEPLHVH